MFRTISRGGFGSFREMERHRRWIETYKKRKENGDNVDVYYQTHTGFQFGMVNAIYHLNYSYSGTNSTGTGTTYFTGDAETKLSGMSYGGVGEHYFPLGRINDNSLMALTFGGEIMYMKFDATELRLNGGYKFSPEFRFFQGSVPLGIAYKSGSDVVFRKSVKSGFSFGGGVLFSATSSFDPESFPALSARPYCMAEIAFFAGICWKIRGTGLLGNPILARGGAGLSGDSEQESSMTLKGKPAVMLSLLFTDFSWDWDED